MFLLQVEPAPSLSNLCRRYSSLRRIIPNFKAGLRRATRDTQKSERSLALVLFLPSLQSVMRILVVIYTLWQLLSYASAKYTNQWAVDIYGGPEEADLVAKETGCINDGKIDKIV